MASYPEIHSGQSYSLSCNNIESDNYINVVFCVNDILTDWLKNDMDIFEAWNIYGFDIASYVYNTLMAEDINNDEIINATDASWVLKGYSLISTGKHIELNSTLFDYNNDGFIDAKDTSDILANMQNYLLFQQLNKRLV